MRMNSAIAIVAEEVKAVVATIVPRVSLSNPMVGIGGDQLPSMQGRVADRTGEHHAYSFSG